MVECPAFSGVSDETQMFQSAQVMVSQDQIDPWLISETSFFHSFYQKILLSFAE